MGSIYNQIDLFLAVSLGVLAWVYAVELTKPEMLLSKVYNLFSKLPHWLFFPLIGCEYCVAGQLGFWVYLFTCYHYNVLAHAIFTAYSIFTITIINYGTEKIRFK